MSVHDRIVLTCDYMASDGKAHGVAFVSAYSPQAGLNPGGEPIQVRRQAADEAGWTHPGPGLDVCPDHVPN